MEEFNAEEDLTDRNLVLFYSRKFKKPFINDFAWVASSYNLSARYSSDPLYLICSSKDPRLAIYSLSSSRPSTWSPQGNIALVDGNSISIYDSAGNIIIDHPDISFQSVDPSQYILSRAKVGYSLNVWILLKLGC